MPKWIRTVSLLLLLNAGLASAQQRAVLHGIVTRTGGKPVKDATVMVYYAGVKQGFSTFCPTCYVDCGKRTLTNAHGSFTISGIDPQLWFILLVAHDGYGSAFTKKLDPAENLPASATLSLRPPVNDPQRIVRGRVVDAKGLPMRDAVIRPEAILRRDERNSLTAVFGRVTRDPIAVTNSRGEFQIDFQEPILKAGLLVEARGMAPRRFREVPAGLTPEIMTLAEGTTIEGRLMHGGKPVGNAEVVISALPQNVGFGPHFQMIDFPYHSDTTR